MLVLTDAGAERRLDASYVAEHLQHAYALTAHTVQGATVEWAGVVGRPEDFTRNWSYTALSRAREPTELFILDTPTERELDRTEIAPGQAPDCATSEPRSSASKRPCAAATTRTSRSTASTTGARGPAHLEPAHAGTAVARPTVVELQAELTQLRERIGQYPEHLVDQLHAARTARTEAQRVADEARARIDELEQPVRGCAAPARRGLRRTRAAAPTPQAHRGGNSGGRRARAQPRRAGSPTAANGRPNAARSASAPPSSTRSSRAAAASTYASPSNGQLRTSRKRWALSLTQPRARRTWQQAATRIEAYRFDHAVTDTRQALGSPPIDTRGRAHWQRAHHDLQRAQRDLGQSNARQQSHEI